MGRLRRETRERLRAVAKNDLEKAVALCADAGITVEEIFDLVQEQCKVTPPPLLPKTPAPRGKETDGPKDE